MSAILVSGLINLETTLRVEAFPVAYEPVRYPFFGVNTTVSGVGYNVALALHRLGTEVTFLSLVGADLPGRMARQEIEAQGLEDGGILPRLERTPQSVILYDRAGARQIHVDLKDIQEQSYPPERFEPALARCSLAVLCNLNLNRPFLSRARQLGVPVATDVHTIHELEDDYNRDFMAAADLLFMSHERLPCAPEDWARRTLERYPAQVLVIGLGPEGALLAVRWDGFMGRFPAAQVRPVVSTIGAGDALFSCFVHSYARSGDPYDSLRRAILYAGYKIGAAGAADGLLDGAGLESLLDGERGCYNTGQQG